MGCDFKAKQYKIEEIVEYYSIYCRIFYNKLISWLGES